MLTTSHGIQSMLNEANNDPEKLAQIINQERDLDAKQVATWIRQAERIMLMVSILNSQQTPIEGLPAEALVEDYTEGLKSPLPMLEDLISNAKKVDASERMLLLNLARGLYADEAGAEEALSNLRQSSSMTPPVRFANEFYADLLRKSGDTADSEAEEYYLREAEFFVDAEYARNQIVQSLISNKDQEGLRKILNNPQYVDSLDAHSRMEIAAILRDWEELARAVIQYDYERGSLDRYMLSFFVALIWIIIVGQFAGFSRRLLLLYAAAMILGILSASATLFAVVIQDNVRGFTLEGDAWHQLTYCIAGIGLREETIKLLFFVPLIPFLRRRPEIESLIVAGFVGLGFAVQENIGYYLGEDFSPWSRFFTANFFHLAMTGLLGLALVQFVRWPRTRWEELLATFLAVVVVHGLYDAFIIIPELSENFLIFTLVIMALIAYRFFDQAEPLAHPGRSRTLSPLGVFILGAALLGGIVMISSCWGSPFREALIGFLNSGLGIVPIVFIFINRFRDA